MRRLNSLGADYFDALYSASDDPWAFETSAYEAEKYARTVAAADGERAASALEVGCSIGVLTERLAPLCDRLTAIDIAPRALRRAKARCAKLDNVEFRRADIVRSSLTETFDLIILSEVVYYWTVRDIISVSRTLERCLRPCGRLLMVHWLGVTDYPLSADEAINAMAAALGELVVEETAARTDDYRLDVWRRRPVG